MTQLGRAHTGGRRRDALPAALRPMAPSDWPAVAAIYRQGIDSGDATFETRVPGWDEWDAARRPDCRIVAEANGRVVGFACIGAVSARPVYAGVCEVMVYVAQDARGQGLGGRLLLALTRAADEAGVWTLQASVFPENVASVRAHKRAGFRVVGTRERIGRFHDGRWRDTILLECRSTVAGVE